MSRTPVSITFTYSVPFSRDPPLPSPPAGASGGCQRRHKTRLLLCELHHHDTVFFSRFYVLVVTETVVDLDHIVRSGERYLRGRG